MEEVTYIVVTNSNASGILDETRPIGPRYTRDSTRALLLLLGCKLRHCFKVVQQVFETIYAKSVVARGSRSNRRSCHVGTDAGGHVYMSIPRPEFNDVISHCLSSFNYRVSPISDDLKICCSLRERRRCVTVLLAGTSGCGKSTLASLLAGRLGIPTVVSTDSIRHMLRGFHPKESFPLLWASTYAAGETFDERRTVGLEDMTAAQRTIKGYKAQCEVVMDYLDKLITRHEEKLESLVVEGVHLSINFLTGLMQRHPSIVPFLVYIKSEGRHTERMAVRAKYMTLDPAKNRYVKHMKHIRLIQDYLVKKAEKRCVPKVENTNVDRSLAIIHATVLGCLKRTLKGEPVLDSSTLTAKVAMTEYLQAMDCVDKESTDMFNRTVLNMSEPDAPSSSGSNAFAPLPIPAHMLFVRGGESCASSSSSLRGLAAASPRTGTFVDNLAPDGQYSASSYQPPCLGPPFDAPPPCNNERNKQPLEYGASFGGNTGGSTHSRRLDGASSDDEDIVADRSDNGGSDNDTEPDDAGFVGYGSMYESTDMDDHEDRDDDFGTWESGNGTAGTGSLVSRGVAGGISRQGSGVSQNRNGALVLSAFAAGARYTRLSKGRSMSGVLRRRELGKVVMGRAGVFNWPVMTGRVIGNQEQRPVQQSVWQES